MKISKIGKTIRGFTLLEVLIALVVAGVGILGTIQLYGVFLNSVKTSEKRSIAFQLADKKIEELRAFQAISDASASFNYEDIASELSSTAVNSTVFTVSTSVESYVVSAGTLSVATTDSDVKELTVAVFWDQSSCNLNDPGEKCVVTRTRIASIDPSLTALAGNPSTQIAGEEPSVEYDPGVVPDVIPIEIGDGTKKESTRPLPEVSSKQGSTEVSFETIRYSPNDNVVSNAEVSLEDYVTVNCTCQFDNTAIIGSGYEPAFLEYDASQEKLVVKYPANTVSKAVATPLDQGEQDQSYLCTSCCRDHHDGGDADDQYRFRWYWDEALFTTEGSVSKGDHEHFYNEDGGQSYTLAVPSSGDADLRKYVENCRFRRVDGIYRLMQDWRLVDMVILPEDYLDSGNAVSDAANLSAYQNYFVSAAESMLVSAAASSDGFANVVPTGVSKPSGRDYNSSGLGEITTLGDEVRLQVRSIYVDPLSSAAAQSILAIKNTAGKYWLDKMPAVEVNTTLLSEWSSADSAIATVSNDALKSLTDPTEEIASITAFTRGVVGAESNGSAYITASGFKTNTGLVGHRVVTKDNPAPAEDDIKYVWTDDVSVYDPNNQVTDSIQVVISSATPSLGNVALGIYCREWYTQANGSIKYGDCDESSIDESKISVSVNGYSCDFDGVNGNGVSKSVDFSCSNVPMNTTYSFVLSATDTYTFYEFDAATMTVDSAKSPYSWPSNSSNRTGYEFYLLKAR